MSWRRKSSERARVENLQGRKNGRLDSGLEEVDDHQGHRVAGQGLIFGVIDIWKTITISMLDYTFKTPSYFVKYVVS